MEIGPTESGGFGAAPLSWREIHYWQECMGLRLQPWEIRMIRRLSAEYVSESSRAEDDDAQAPWTDNSPRDSLAAARSLQAAIERMAQ